MTGEEEVIQLRAENRALREDLRVALARIEELEKLKTPPAAFVKASKKKSPEGEKKSARNELPSTIMVVPDQYPHTSWSIGW
jgi:hypothetical protein